jgi:putative membrane protein insertion efficiency factor
MREYIAHLQADPNHPRARERAEQDAARREYEARIAANPAAQRAAWADYERSYRRAYRRRLMNELRYRPPLPRPQKAPGQVEQTCDTCGRIENRIDCLTCGCFSMTWLAWLLPTRTAPTPRLLLPTRTARPTLPARAGLAAIRGYQRGISAHTPARCRFTPTCSQYGAQAVRRYGLAAGTRLIAARLHRCTPDVPRGTPDPLS